MDRGIRRNARLLRLTALVASLATSGCVLFEINQQHELDRGLIRVGGTVSIDEPLEGTLVVALISRGADGEESADDAIVDHYVVERSGSHYQFYVTDPGRYALAAFNDRDTDFLYEKDEPVLVSSPVTTFDLVKGQHVEDVELVVGSQMRASPERPIEILQFRSRSVHDQFGRTLGQVHSVGEVADISDPRFAADVGPKGLWRPYDFVFEIGAGVFFLEPYDPDRVPVLFVHGILGFPAQFELLIDGLDTTRFQPWVYLYPSGARLENVGEHLSQVMVQLESRHQYEHVALVAHSMGGLVSRAFLLRHFEQTGRHPKREFITISTPWGGQESATLAAERMSNPVYSWVDVAPGSEFLGRLFLRADGTRRMLPPGTDFNIVFSFRGKTSGGPLVDLFDPVAGMSNDGVVSVRSQLTPEAQFDARSIWGIDATHTGILTDPGTVDRVNRLLGHYLDEL